MKVFKDRLDGSPGQPGLVQDLKLDGFICVGGLEFYDT